MMRTEPHSLERLLPRTLVLVSVVALAVGFWQHGHFWRAGFPLSTLDGMQRTLRLGLLAAFGFVLIYSALRKALAGRSSRFLPAPWFPAALATAPWALWLGYEFNRAKGFRPSDLLGGYALQANLQILALLFVLWILASLWMKYQEGATRPSKRWYFFPAALLAFLAVGLDFSFGRSVEHDRPNILVLLVDALRADHLGSYGYRHDTSPAIDSLAEDGVLFSNAIAQSTFTKSSIASLFTGRNPYQHGVYWGSHKENPQQITSDLLRLEEETLAEHMQAAGYLTNAWVQNSHLRDFMGFGQGFVDYNDQQGSIQRIHGKAFPFFRGAAQRYNFFTYLHYIDLHDPYLPPAPYDARFGTCEGVYEGIDLSQWGAFLKAVRNGATRLSEDEMTHLRACYDGLIRLVDDEIARLLAELRRLDLYDDTLIVLTSDHGDGFLEHGFISHSTTPYEELVRIPLIVKFPQGKYSGQVIEEQVRSVDVMPTLLAAAGIEGELDEVAGCSLMPLLGGGPLRDPTCSQAISEIAEDGSDPTLSVRTNRFKLIRFAPRNDRYFDLQADPMEQNPLDSLDDPEASLLAQVADFIGASRNREETETIELDEQQIRELKALGYLD